MTLLLWTALGVGIMHTLVGPDHYVPFIAIAKSSNWSIRRTVSFTLICGLTHIVSAVTIGSVFLFLGRDLPQAPIAAWLLMSLGLAYAIWGVRNSIRKRIPEREGWSGWVLFLVFVFGPCEPLIPLVVVPLIRGDFAEAASVGAVFGVATLSTMLTLVLSATFALRSITWSWMERYGRVLAGSAIFACGAAVQFLGF